MSDSELERVETMLKWAQENWAEINMASDAGNFDAQTIILIKRLRELRVLSARDIREFREAFQRYQDSRESD